MTQARDLLLEQSRQREDRMEREQTDWDRRRQRMEQRIATLEAAQTSLQQQVAELTADNQAKQKSIDKLEETRQKLEDERDRLTARTEEAERENAILRSNRPSATADPFPCSRGRRGTMRPPARPTVPRARLPTPVIRLPQIRSSLHSIYSRAQFLTGVGPSSPVRSSPVSHVQGFLHDNRLDDRIDAILKALSPHLKFHARLPVDTSPLSLGCCNT